MSQLNYTLKSAKSQVSLDDQLFDSDKYNSVEKLKSFLMAMNGGNEAAILEVAFGATAAHATFTVASSGAQSVTVDGATLTGGTDYAIANLTPAQVAANLAAAVNASVNEHIQLVQASANAAVVTVTALAGGIIGNKVAVSATGAAAASGANLAGGVAGELQVLKFGLAL